MFSNRDVAALARFGVLCSLLVACDAPITEPAPTPVPAFRNHGTGPVVSDQRHVVHGMVRSLVVSSPPATGFRR
jgi:hypothetical protein